MTFSADPEYQIDITFYKFVKFVLQNLTAASINFPWHSGHGKQSKIRLNTRKANNFI